jgi:hypothetical protein
MSVQQVGTETLVYDERRHRAFCLNESSSIVWNLADGKRNFARICEEASATLGVAVSEELVMFALDQLQSDGLLEELTVDTPAISRRALLQRLGMAGALLLPAVASIMAPTAAQAYSGCFDCSSVAPSRAARARRLQQSNGTKPSSNPSQ